MEDTTMAKNEEDRRQGNASAEAPSGAGGGQMGQQKTGAQKPPPTREERQPGRDAKPDMPPDPGGRVRPESSGHRGALRPEDLPPPQGPRDRR